MMTRDEFMELLPEIALLRSEADRTRCADTWLEAMRDGGWDRASLGLFYVFAEVEPSCRETLLSHTGQVVRACLALFDALEDREKYDREALTAGALLHDVGKLIEYGMRDGELVHPERGMMFKHPVSGAYYAKKNGFGDKVAHMILAHSEALSPEGANAYVTPESLILKQVDAVCFRLAVRRD